ncbi:ABC transporter permease [Aporhodopirellula aestuarii]|uniref:ABC transporter permease n=1 Tax=Aporhodopirellula aestuarii TaxID=2950107 RepID=A0ABT0U732_9BACT|nr:ABC transporter permease [Aporhodopirellula aestuarii]MCM2372489.1 ABC transporter permease [Aporhodopirellula aestuarii]
MLGPVFNREATVAPKRSSTYLARGIYLLTLFLLLCTGYLVLDGSRSLFANSDAAKFGGWMFRLLAPLELVILSALAAVSAASNVAQEKDRRTLLLLLMTRLSGFEIVVGKTASALLTPLSLLVVSLPLFLTLPLLGGVAPSQVFAVFLVITVSVIVSAAVGTVVAFWREKTFQSIALTFLVLLLLVAAGEILASSTLASTVWATAISPPRALIAATNSKSNLATVLQSGAGWFVIMGSIVSACVLAIGIAKVRVWNPSREVRLKAPEPETSEEYLRDLSAAGVATEGGTEAIREKPHVEGPASWKVRQPRHVWDNPILWREVRTWAYGRKILLIRAVFVLMFAIIAGAIWYQVQSGVAMEPSGRIGRAFPAVTIPMAALGVISLVLVNALAVTSITGERDGLALDLLLVTDLRPREFIFGKLFGVMYAAKELILLPLGLIVYLGVAGVMTIENMQYAILAAIGLYVFVTMLGIHSGLNYVSGRTATLASLGTVFFLCVGIAICMTIMVSFRGAFQLQLAPFLVMILGGGAALFAALGWRNPSSAIFTAAFALPLITFYAITQFLLQTDHLYVAAALIFGYGFTTAAMMIPALSEFDVPLEVEPSDSPAELSA